MQERRRRQVLAEVDRVARSATEATALLRSVAEVVATAVPFDRWCGLGFDPSTGLPTSGYHAEGLPVASFPRLLDLEFGDHTDVGRLADVARAERPVVVLSEALGRDPARSARYRAVLEPAGLPHELRVVPRDGRTPWGALILFRGSDAADFAADEVHLMELLAPRVAEALRRA